MRRKFGSIVPNALGLILIADACAVGCDLVTTVRDDEWRPYFRLELAFLGGLWLLVGLAPKSTRIVALSVVMGILAYDGSRAIASLPPRYAFGQVSVGSWWIMASDQIVIFAFFLWRPTSNRVMWNPHPLGLAGIAVLFAGLGIAIDRSQLGRFPIEATARSGGASSSPGLDYLVYLPEGYHLSRRRWPLILDLHGGGAWGREVARVRTGGLPLRIDSGLRLPFVVVAPQSPKQGWDPEPLDALLTEVLGCYRVDPERVYLTGSSMGGYGVWALATAHPERFAAIAPICGGGDPAAAERLRTVPTWAFHGSDDTVIPADESLKMVSAQERSGGEALLTIYPGVGHDAATPPIPTGSFMIGCWPIGGDSEGRGRSDFSEEQSGEYGRLGQGRPARHRIFNDSDGPPPERNGLAGAPSPSADPLLVLVAPPDRRIDRSRPGGHLSLRLRIRLPADPA